MTHIDRLGVGLLLYLRFRLKFQRIVEVEQGSNFISQLHNGQLTIVPWPVIESRQFYTLFPSLKKTLFEQPITHQKAGIFLQTMKTLMAKLKVSALIDCTPEDHS